MEIKSTNTASLNSKTVHKLQDLLLKYDTASFKAIVTHKISNQFFSINTQAGTLQISTDLPIMVGDKLLLKTSIDKAQQPANLEILKIDRPILTNTQLSTHLLNKELAPTLLLNHHATLKNIPQTQQHFVAKIISHDKNAINLQNLKGESFFLKQNSFINSGFTIKSGEYLAIKWMNSQNLEIQHINKEQLLHQIQRQLLPKQQPLQQTHQKLSQAAFKLFEAINNDATPLAKKNDHVANKQTIISDTFFMFKKIKHELNQLLSSNRISFKFLSSDTIQKLLSNLDILSQSKNPIANQQSFTQKLSLINQTITDLLHEIDKHSKNSKNSSIDENSFLDALKSSLKEARQSFELTLSKVLFQNTSIKLNQEINNTLLINAQIPFEIEKQTKDINLKIKQHKSETEEQEDTWEIHLSLEMGALGMISTKIMLKDQFDVSIQFWAELINTKQLIEDKKNIFVQQMKNAGFSLSTIDIYLGKKIEEAMPVNISNKQFIDINV